jgi:hypothetical protein
MQANQQLWSALKDAAYKQLEGKRGAATTGLSAGAHPIESKQLSKQHIILIAASSHCMAGDYHYPEPAS